jgi:hypothetical protein
MNHVTIQHDPADLREHDIVRHLPRMADDSAQFEALCADILDRGLIEPLKITRTHQLVDGRHRWRAAKRAGLIEVPCIIVADEEIAGIVLSTLIHRRHYTKGALAYLAYPLMAGAHQEAKEAAMQNLRKGQQIPVSHSVGNGKTTADFALQIGVGRTLFDYAAKIHDIFDADPEYKALMEPQILDTEKGVGLGAVIAGYGGKKATKGAERVDNDQLELFSQALDRINNRSGYWASFDDATKLRLVPMIRKSVAEMPADLRKEFMKALKAADQEQAS